MQATSIFAKYNSHLKHYARAVRFARAKRSTSLCSCPMYILLRYTHASVNKEAHKLQLMVVLCVHFADL